MASNYRVPFNGQTSILIYSYLIRCVGKVVNIYISGIGHWNRHGLRSKKLICDVWSRGWGENVPETSEGPPSAKKEKDKKNGQFVCKFKSKKDVVDVEVEEPWRSLSSLVLKVNHGRSDLLLTHDLCYAAFTNQVLLYQLRRPPLPPF